MSQGVRGSPRSPVFIGLAAIAMAVPLAVLAGAAGPYDDPKAWSLPLLVAATVVVGLVRSRTLPGREGPADDGPGRVLCWTIAASLGWWFITTAVSIAPGQSLLGVFGRGMGLITIGAAALVFFVVRIECRSARAMWGLIDAALLGSVPVCVLALGQAAGWDPLPGSWDPAVVDLGVRSTLGQHTFLGSYLVVLVPLAAGRLDSALRACRAAESVAGARGVPVAALVTGAVWTAGALGLVELASGWDPGWWLLVPWGIAGAAVWALVGAAARERPGSPIAVALLALLLLMQVAVVVLSRARGALLATLLGLVVAGVAMLAGRRARKMLALSAATAGLVVLGIGLLNVPDSPLAPLARIGVLSRLSHVTDVGRGTPGWFRLRVWKGIASGWRRQLAGEEVVPDTRPVLRSVIGYGPETQLLVLEPFSRPSLGVRRAGGSGWRGQYLVDRAHNALLDQLVTGGLVGAGLWLTLVGSLIAVGVSRVRRASPGEEWSIRWACLAAVMAHIAEGQVGVETVAPLVLFWMAAGLLSTPPWSPPPTPRPDSPSSRRSAWLLAVVAVSLAAVLIAWLGTRWLLASMWYADGVRLQIAGQLAEAHASFGRSRELQPWLPLSADAVAQSALRLAGAESDPARRLQRLHEGEDVLADIRVHALRGAGSWALLAQLTFAEVRAGERDKLPASLAAFETAARLRPWDADLLAQWGWALLESGDPAKARRVAERALDSPPGRRGGSSWLAWAVLARSAGDLGDASGAQRAADEARRLAPPEARRLLQTLLPS